MIRGLMSQPKVLLVVDDGELRARYEMTLRFSGSSPSPSSSSDQLETSATRTDRRLPADRSPDRRRRHLLDPAGLGDSGRPHRSVHPAPAGASAVRRRAAGDRRAETDDLRPQAADAARPAPVLSGRGPAQRAAASPAELQRLAHAAEHVQIRARLFCGATPIMNSIVPSCSRTVERLTASRLRRSFPTRCSALSSAPAGRRSLVRDCSRPGAGDRGWCGRSSAAAARCSAAGRRRCPA